MGCDRPETRSERRAGTRARRPNVSPASRAGAGDHGPRAAATSALVNPGLRERLEEGKKLGFNRRNWVPPGGGSLSSRQTFGESATGSFPRSQMRAALALRAAVQSLGLAFQGLLDGRSPGVAWDGERGDTWQEDEGAVPPQPAGRPMSRGRRGQDRPEAGPGGVQSPLPETDKAEKALLIILLFPFLSSGCAGSAGPRAPRAGGRARAEHGAGRRAPSDPAGPRKGSLAYGRQKHVSRPQFLKSKALGTEQPEILIPTGNFWGPRRHSWCFEEEGETRGREGGEPGNSSNEKDAFQTVPLQK